MKYLKKTKILATLGPSTNDKVMKEMVNNGVNAFRINTAHGNIQEYDKFVKHAKQLKIPILLDIKGPELRIRTEHDIKVGKGEIIAINCEKKGIYFSHDVYEDLRVNDKLYIENGRIETKVVKKQNKKIYLEIRQEAIIRPNKGVNVPGRHLNIPAVSAQDKKMIAYAKKEGINFLAVSFVRTKEDILNIRKHCKEFNLIAKIENQEGCNNVEEIIRASDGIMVARGDLGIEIPQEKIPLIQKQIVKKCNHAGKLSIIATQMLESMIEQKIPTRAETSDVANAVLDGADCVMLSGETSIGKHPVDVVKTMSKILMTTEKEIKAQEFPEVCNDVSDAISKAVADMCTCLPITKIVAITNKGATAQLLSRFRLKQEIIAFTPRKKTFELLHLYYGMTPIYDDLPKEHLVSSVAKILLENKILNKKDTALFTAGVRTKKERQSNLIEIHDVQDLIKFYY